MSVKIENLEVNKVKVTFDVSEAEVSQAIEQSFKKNASKVNVPGFRKGKVPRQMFVKMFGITSLYPDAIDFMVNAAYQKSLENKDFDPVDYPDINYNELVENFKEKSAITFDATVTIRPVPELGAYKGVTYEPQSAEVTAEDINDELATMQDRKSEWVVKEDGVAEIGDTVVIDFEGFIDDIPFDGGKGSNHSLELGSNSFIPGFEEQLVGHGIGEEVDVELSFPEDYQASELAGKPAVFKCLIHDMKRKEAPELSDEFAKEVDPDVETLDELKDKIKERLESTKKLNAKQLKENSIIDSVVDEAKFEIPEVMIQHELDYMVQDFERRMQMQGMNLEMYFQYTGQDVNMLKEQMKPDAIKQIRRSLVLSEIAKSEKFEVSVEDVQDEIAGLAMRLDMTIEEVKKNLGANTVGLMNDILIKKTVDFLIENAVEKDK